MKVAKDRRGMRWTLRAQSSDGTGHPCPASGRGPGLNQPAYGLRCLDAVRRLLGVASGFTLTLIGCGVQLNELQTHDRCDSVIAHCELQIFCLSLLLTTGYQLSIFNFAILHFIVLPVVAAEGMALVRA
jgi:hypothetical protein